MRDLIRMDLYRMRKARGFRVMLILALFFGLVITPIEEGFAWLVRITGDDPEESAQVAAMLFSPTSGLSGIIGNPFPLMNAMLMFLSGFIFMGADSSRGYIKNTIGLMPRRAHSLMAEFVTLLIHNAVFMLAGMIGNLIGTAIFRQIVFDNAIWTGLLSFLTKYVLAMALTTLIMWLTVGKGNKGLGIITCVLAGCRMLTLIWELISMGVRLLIKSDAFSLSEYMPDQLLYAADLKQPYAILLAIGLLALMLPLAIRAFEKRDL